MESDHPNRLRRSKGGCTRKGQELRVRQPAVEFHEPCARDLVLAAACKRRGDSRPAVFLFPLAAVQQYQPARADKHAPCHADRYYHRQPHSYTHSDADVDEHAHCHQDCQTYVHSNADANQHAYAHAVTHVNQHAPSHRNHSTNRHPDPCAHGDVGTSNRDAAPAPAVATTTATHNHHRDRNPDTRAHGDTDIDKHAPTYRNHRSNQHPDTCAHGGSDVDKHAWQLELNCCVPPGGFEGFEGGYAYST